MADHPRRFGAVAGPDSRLRRIQVDQVLLDEPRLLGRMRFEGPLRVELAIAAPSGDRTTQQLFWRGDGDRL